MPTLERIHQHHEAESGGAEDGKHAASLTQTLRPSPAGAAAPSRPSMRTARTGTIQANDSCHQTEGLLEEHRQRAPIACSLEQADLADRQSDWRELANSAGVDVQTTADGLRLRFHRAPGIEREVRRLARLERQCCAFANWAVHVGEDHVTLNITAASEEGVAAVQAMFGALRAPTA